MDHKMQEKDIIVGRNAVTEALNSGRELDKIFVADGNFSGSLSKIVAIAKQRGIVVKQVGDQKLRYLSGTESHQGVVATASCAKYATVEEMLKAAEEKREAPFLIFCDNIEDPHNLGALIRTAEAAGAHGLVIPKRRSASLTSIIRKPRLGQ